MGSVCVGGVECGVGGVCVGVYSRGKFYFQSVIKTVKRPQLIF